MSISTVNYHNTFSSKLDITTILDIPTYNALHQMELDLKPTLFMFTKAPGGPLIGILDFW